MISIYFIELNYKNDRFYFLCRIGLDLIESKFRMNGTSFTSYEDLEA